MDKSSLMKTSFSSKEESMSIGHPELRMDAVSGFLNQLGLQAADDINEPAYWRSLHQEIADAAGVSRKAPDLSDPMGETMVDYFFTTPDIARKFLAADIPRLTHLLGTLDTLPGFPDRPQAIAEIGGGPGILSLWLANIYPDARITVYDRSENALAVGRAWANTLGVTNIRYEKTSYQSLAESGCSERFDLVLGLGALDLNIRKGGGEPHFCADAEPEKLLSGNRSVGEFAAACKNILAPGGMLHFSQGSFTDLGLLCLFHAFRENGLGLDWRHSFGAGEGDGAGFSLKALHLFAVPDHPTVFRDARDDLAVILYASRVSRFSDKTVLGHGDFEAWLGLLSDGTKLADIRTRRDNGREERFSIYVKSGVLGFFSSHSDGGRSGYIFNAAFYESAVERLKTVIESYRQGNVAVIRSYWHPLFNE
jgi:hypothetical protein